MSRREFTRTIDIVMRKWAPLVTEAALGFEARWTRRALRFHNPKLADAFEAQLDRYERAMDEGTSTEIDTEGARLCRAYAMIAAELQAAKVPDDAYMVGRDAKTGLEIIIAATPAAGEHARAQGGHRFAKWFSPDEIATIIALDARAMKIAEVKAAFPGAEIMEVNNDAD